MIRYKGSRRTCFDCGGQWAIVSFERHVPTQSGIQGKFRCLSCGADSIVYFANCETAPGDAVEVPPLPQWVMVNVTDTNFSRGAGLLDYSIPSETKTPAAEVTEYDAVDEFMSAIIPEEPPAPTSRLQAVLAAERPRKKRQQTLEERFWSQVVKGEGPDDCWLWQGRPLPRGGHGTIRIDGHDFYAHRVSWELHYGPLDDSIQTLHKCDVPLCVRPDHLFLGTQADNMIDAAEKQRTTLGELDSQAKLTSDQVREIRRRREAGELLRVLSDEFGVAEATISRAANGVYWPHIEMPARYAQSPVKRWVGSKTALLPKILPLVPPKFGTYYEPFLGSGAVAFALLGLRRDGAVSFDRAVLADTNQRLIRAYNGIRDNIDGVIAGLYETGHLYDSNPETTYENARALTYVDASRAFCPLDERDDVTMAVWFLFVNAVCFNGVYRTNAKDEYNVPLGKNGKKAIPFTFDEVRLRDASALLRGPHVELWLQPWEETVPLGTASAADVLYIDPPYASLSETAEFGSKKGGYGSGDGFGRGDQLLLAGTCGGLANRGATVIASNADVNYLHEAYAASGFTIVEVSRKGTVSSGKDRARVSEMLAYANAVRPVADVESFTLAKTPTVSPEPPKAKTKMAKKKELTDPTRSPPVTITRVTSNVKGARIDQPWSVEVFGSKILVVGENGVGKSRLLNAIELALSGRGTDVVLRDPALPAELLNLAPPGTGELMATVEFSNSARSTFEMPIFIAKGERKASRPTLASTVNNGATLPMRALEEAITGSADKARAFFLTAIENTTTDTDVVALLPALWHEMWTRATTGTRAGLPAPTKVLLVIDAAREQQRSHRDAAKANYLLVEQLGERLAGGMPTDMDVAAKQAAIAEIDRKLRELDELQRFSHAIEARQKLAVLRAELQALPVPNAQAQKNHDVLQAVRLVLETAHENGMESCPICNTGVSQDTFAQAAANLQAVMTQEHERNALADATARERQRIEYAIHTLSSAAQEGTEIPPWQGSLSSLDVANIPAARDALFIERSATASALQQLELLRARWNDIINARDKGALAEREQVVWAQFEKSLVEARDALIRRAVQTFEQRVNLFLPAGDRFGLRLNDDTGREVFQLGLWRGDDSPVFHAALSGAEVTRVLCAVASVLSERQEGAAIIIPREREHSKRTLARTLKALADAPGTIVLTHVENPGERATKGWYVIDVDAQTNGAGVEPNGEDAEVVEPVAEPSSILPSILGGPLLGGRLGTDEH